MLILRKKKEIIDEMTRIDKQIGIEKRTMTADEMRKWESLKSEADSLAAEAENEERQQQLEMAAVSPGKNRETKGLNLTEEDRSFLNFVRKGPAILDSTERRALVEDSTGQYLISPAVEAELQRSLAKLVPIRQLASKRTLDKDRILVRDIDEVSVGWGKLETSTEITESSPTPSEVTKYVEDLYGLAKIGQDELEDSDYDLVMYLADSFARSIGEKEQLGFLTGRGHATYGEPEGITVDATLVAAAKTTTAAAVVTIDDFLKCVYEVPAKYRPGSAWMFSSITELAVRKLRWDGGGGAGTGGYFWQPAVAQGAPPTFLGYPVYNSDDMADLSGTEGVIAIFGNFQLGYRILDRQGTRIQRLNELYAEAGLVGFILHYRVSGYPIRPSNKALVLLKEHSA